MKTTLKDIAQRLGVSIATVSRALRSSPEISPEMQERVKSLARELNFRPNPFAQSLRSDSPKVIGVVTPNLVTHYYSAVLDGIEGYARDHGYSVVSANSHESVDDERRAIDNFLNLHVDGIICCLAQTTTDYSHLEALHRQGVPLVLFGRTCLPELFSSVTANGDQAAYQATRHLIDSGCRRIAFVGGPNHIDMVRRRKHGYLEALREARLPIDRTLVACGSIDFGVASDAVRRLLDRPDRPDAILAFNDIITFAALDTIHHVGLRVPQDIALIGFTDDVHAEYVTPRLSVVADQSQLLGQTACRLLLDTIQGDTALHHEIVPQKIVIRESTRH